MQKLFFQKKSKFLPGMIAGTVLGTAVGAACLIATDKKKRSKMMKTVGSFGKKMADQMHMSM